MIEEIYIFKSSSSVAVESEDSAKTSLERGVRRLVIDDDNLGKRAEAS